jgi:hypothetical protein
MRELNKRVIGCGVRSSTSRLLVHACDEFIFYDTIAKTRKTRERARQRKGPATTTDMEAALHLLQDAVDGLQREIPDPPYASVVKNAMQRKSPDFTESDFGFHTFGRFLEAAQKAGLVRLIREQKSGGYRVDGAGDNDSSESPDVSSGSTKTSNSQANMACWLDPYLPKGTAPLAQALNAEGINPLAAPTRQAILDGVAESVKSRKERKRRINVQFVQEDVRRRMRKSHPDVPGKAIRSIFNGLMRAGVLLHRDGSPVRTGSAPFTLDKDAPELNEALADIYLDAIHHSELDMPAIELLADLFHGNPKHVRRIEETIAYLQANAQEDLDDAEFDSLLTVDHTAEVAKEPAPKDSKSADKTVKAEAAEEPSPKKAPKKRAAAPKKKTTPAKSRVASSKKAEAVDTDTTDSAPPKKKTTRKRKTTKADE